MEKGEHAQLLNITPSRPPVIISTHHKLGLAPRINPTRAPRVAHQLLASHPWFKSTPTLLLTLRCILSQLALESNGTPGTKAAAFSDAVTRLRRRKGLIKFWKRRRNVLWRTHRWEPSRSCFVFGTKEVIWSGIHEAYVLIFAEPQGLAIKEGERFLQEWMPIGLCWRVIQKWTDKHRWDRTNPAYNAVKEIVKEVLADGLNFLEDYHGPRPTAHDPRPTTCSKPASPSAFFTHNRKVLSCSALVGEISNPSTPATDRRKTGVSSIDSFHGSLC
jgi:hypothetical protein